MFESEEKKDAKSTLEVYESKIEKFSSVVESMKNGDYNGDSDEIQATYDNLATLEGNSLGMQIDLTKRGYKDLAEKAAGLYTQARRMKAIVERTAEKEEVSLDDDPED
ncbi:MAG: hypothetical protein ACE5J7_03065 [Candidatus Aenigmatarchaeota archaeon]